MAVTELDQDVGGEMMCATIDFLKTVRTRRATMSDVISHLQTMQMRNTPKTEAQLRPLIRDRQHLSLKGDVVTLLSPRPNRIESLVFDHGVCNAANALRNDLADDSLLIQLDTMIELIKRNVVIAVTEKERNLLDKERNLLDKDREILLLEQELAVMDTRRALDLVRDICTRGHRGCSDDISTRSMVFGTFIDHILSCKNAPGADLLSGVDPDHLKETWTQASKKSHGVRVGKVLLLPDHALGYDRITIDYPFEFMKRFLEQTGVTFKIVPRQYNRTDT